jgi:cell division protein FtsW (lipid II flippase)
MAMGIAFLTDFDIFAGGIISAAILFAYFWALTYFFVRGMNKKADEFSLQILLPPLLVSFFFSVIVPSSIITGVCVILAYFLSYRHYTKVDYEDWIKHILVVLIVLMILAMVDDLTRIILLAVLLIFVALMGERRMHEKRGTKREREKAEK